MGGFVSGGFEESGVIRRVLHFRYTRLERREQLPPRTESGDEVPVLHAPLVRVARRGHTEPASRQHALQELRRLDVRADEIRCRAPRPQLGRTLRDGGHGLKGIEGGLLVHVHGDRAVRKLCVRIRASLQLAGERGVAEQHRVKGRDAAARARKQQPSASQRVRERRVDHGGNEARLGARCWVWRTLDV